MSKLLSSVIFSLFLLFQTTSVANESNETQTEEAAGSASEEQEIQPEVSQSDEEQKEVQGEEAPSEAELEAQRAEEAEIREAEAAE